MTADSHDRRRTNVEARVELLERLAEWVAELPDAVVVRAVEILDADPGARDPVTAVELAGVDFHRALRLAIKDDER